MKVSRSRIALVSALIVVVLLGAVAYKFDVVAKIRNVGLAKSLRLVQEKLSKEGFAGLWGAVADKLEEDALST